MDVQCVTMTFRDGNTTDSNLLEVITASQPSDPIQFEGLYEKELGQKSSPPVYHQQEPSYQYDDEEFDDEDEEESEEDNGEDAGLVEGNDKIENEDESVLTDDDMDTKGSVRILRIESTGPSLSIGTTSDSSKNCSGQFIYFIAYYTTIQTPVAGDEIRQFINLLSLKRITIILPVHHILMSAQFMVAFNIKRKHNTSVRLQYIGHLIVSNILITNSATSNNIRKRVGINEIIFYSTTARTGLMMSLIAFRSAFCCCCLPVPR